MFNQKIKKMYANQFQIESGSTEKYADNHRYIANELGDAAETGESLKILLVKLIAYEKSVGVDLGFIIDHVRTFVESSEELGKIEKNIFRKFENHGMFNLTEEQIDAVKSIELAFTPEEVEHYTSEKGDELFHIARGLASNEVDLEFALIKNRAKLTKRDITGTIHSHLDH